MSEGIIRARRRECASRALRDQPTMACWRTSSVSAPPRYQDAAGTFYERTRSRARRTHVPRRRARRQTREESLCLWIIPRVFKNLPSSTKSTFRFQLFSE